MPDLATLREGPVNATAGPEGKLSLLLWAMKRHQGELRMFGGIWKKHSSGEIPKGADQQFKLTPEELLALERRTHPLTCEQDHIDPVVYTALEIRAQVNRGERPAPEQVVGIFWAKGDGVCWTRQTRTWDLPSLTGVYAHRFTFKYIYSAWTTFPLIVKTQRRGRNAEGSASDKWMGNILQMRKEAVPFLESLGIPKPRSRGRFWRPRDERLVLGDASTPHMRFSSSNGLADVSTALWSVIMSR